MWLFALGLVGYMSLACDSEESALPEEHAWSGEPVSKSVMGWPGPYASSCIGPMRPEIDVVFSPQPYASSHLARTARLIDQAQRSIDIAMYGMGDQGILDALARAAARGVSIRVILDTARDARSDPRGSTAAQLEDAGIDVRWINRIMHHKLAIIDGMRGAPRVGVYGVLVTGSANWSLRAGTVYDESTLFIRCVPELFVAFQRELDHLWASSRDFVWNHSLAQAGAPPRLPWMLPGKPPPRWPPGVLPRTSPLHGQSAEAVFTSANFVAYESPRHGPTFSWVEGERSVAERMVALIEGAERSILLASTHLRSRLISEALMAKAAARPDMDIRILLDGQEWISAGYHQKQTRALDRCLKAAEGEDAVADCLYGGFHFSYQMHLQGVPIRFKYYAYRWDYAYAPQMHHKFLLVDGRTVATGSYNLSDNAETNTMENLVILDGAWYPEVARAFEQELERLWTMGQGRYRDMLEELFGGTDPIPLVFEPMALDWAQVATVRDAIQDACPQVDSEPYREAPAKHRVCYR